MRNSDAVPNGPSAEANPVERATGVPPGKRVLNTHISLEEHSFLKSMASKNSMTVTMFLRNLIRKEMHRNRDVDLRQFGT